MREILFRGKRTDNGDWTFGDLVHSGDKCYIHPYGNAFKVSGSHLSKLVIMHEVILETVGQHTGLIDDTEDKIFEGDIVYGHFETEIGEEYYFTDVVKLPYPTEYEFASKLVVIGNIHDNPELMKGE